MANIRMPKSLNNRTCAYRSCTNHSEKRLFFPLGFSALFCIECAKLLIRECLAKELGVESFGHDSTKAGHNQEKNNVAIGFGEPGFATCSQQSLGGTEVD